MRRPGSRLLLLIALLAAASSAAAEDAVRIFVARKIITMEPDPREAKAVAVAGGRILAVGDLEEVEASLGVRGAEIDRRFEEKVMLPGFIEPHFHPSLAATILPLDTISAMSWQKPDGATEVVRGRDAFLAALVARDASLPEGRWLIAWGYHRPYHGELSRADLDEISRERPIVIWQRSVHEMFFNSRALDALGYREADFARTEQSDWEKGHVYEAGLFAVAGSMLARLSDPESYARGLAMMSEVIRRGGITTVAEQGFPQINDQLEYSLLTRELAKKPPYRFVLVPNAMFLMRQEETVAAAELAATELLARSTDRIRVVKHVKFYADGAIFSQLMKLRDGYLDGHHGEWMMPPAVQEEVLGTFWDRGWSLHIHVNGDAALDLLLDMIERKRKEGARDDVRIVLEHYGYAREDQHARVKALGIAVSNNSYYLHELAPPYAREGMGPERARDISPLGGLVRAGVRFSLHSDYPMAPALPLTLAWVAANRIASDGEVWAPDQKVSVDLALRAITIESAWSLGLEEEIGSIAPGKRADFTILEEDPYTQPASRLKDIPIWGTVFEGEPHPLD